MRIRGCEGVGITNFRDCEFAAAVFPFYAWTPEAGTMRRFNNLRGRIVRLAFSPEGTTLAAVVRGGMQLGLWEMPDGKFRWWHPYIDAAVSTCAYSPSGKWFVIGG